MVQRQLYCSGNSTKHLRQTHPPHLYQSIIPTASLPINSTLPQSQGNLSGSLEGSASTSSSLQSPTEDNMALNWVSIKATSTTPPPPQTPLWHHPPFTEDWRTVFKGVPLGIALSQAVLMPPSPSYKSVTSRSCDRGNLSYDPICDSSCDLSATCTWPWEDTTPWPWEDNTWPIKELVINKVTWQDMLWTHVKPVDQHVEDHGNNQQRCNSLGQDPNQEIWYNPQLLCIDCTVPRYL